MTLVVAYDVAQEDREGARRLRRVAKVCTGYGQRVQYSVFECEVTPAQAEQMERQLQKAMDKEHDSLRIYVLLGDRDHHVRVFGRDRWVDFSGTLIV